MYMVPYTRTTWGAYLLSFFQKIIIREEIGNGNDKEERGIEKKEGMIREEMVKEEEMRSDRDRQRMIEK